MNEKQALAQRIAAIQDAIERLTEVRSAWMTVPLATRTAGAEYSLKFRLLPIYLN